MINFIIYDPTTGDITANGVADLPSFYATEASNPSLSFLIGLGHPSLDRVDLDTMKIVPRERDDSITPNNG